MAAPDERYFKVFRRGEVRDDVILAAWRNALRDLTNPDTGITFTEDEIAIMAMLLDDYYQQSLHAPLAPPEEEPPRQRQPQRDRDRDGDRGRGRGGAQRRCAGRLVEIRRSDGEPLQSYGHSVGDMERTQSTQILGNFVQVLHRN